MKKLVLLNLILIIFIGCSNLDDPIEEVKLSSMKTEMDYFNFSTKEESQNKLDQILSLKESYNTYANQTFFSNSDKEMNRSNKEETIEVKLSEDYVRPYIVAYHEELLKSIYSLRKELGFISIQSIADEINSLELIKPAKAYELYNLYEKYLTKSVIGVNTIFQEPMAELISSNGKLMLEGKLLDLDEFKVEEYNNIDLSNLLKKIENTNDTKLDLSNTNNISSRLRPQSAVRLLGYNYGLRFVVLWDAGRARNRSNWWWRYDYFSRITTWAKIGTRFYRYPVNSYRLKSTRNFAEFRKINRSSYIRANTPYNGSRNHYFVGRYSKSSGQFRLYKAEVSRGDFYFKIGPFTFPVHTWNISEYF
ncbi:hypothetical protein [Tenacibaculum aestuariivivum]|uniref:hypothetical protein n=1 Tax=Tenacibaculum aestuariivivum TaxID=2006131 RepID=UPI003AB73597